jgi:hypothetical protein
MRNKKGELTTTQLVTIIILIASFAVILFFIFRLNLGETTDKEICHNSVVLRGQSKIGTGPLDCRTSYVCISGGGECEGITATKTIEAETRDEVMNALAEEMASCWFMFGEGKKNNIDYVGYSWKPDFLVGTHCAICSIVEFDENVQEISEISYDVFYNYLSQTKKEGTQTYLNYLYGINSPDFLESKLENSDLIGRPISTGVTYRILTGMKGEEDYIYPHILESATEVSCDHFDLTKA